MARHIMLLPPENLTVPGGCKLRNALLLGSRAEREMVFCFQTIDSSFCFGSTDGTMCHWPTCQVRRAEDKSYPDATILLDIFMGFRKGVRGHRCYLGSLNMLFECHLRVRLTPSNYIFSFYAKNSWTHVFIQTLLRPFSQEPIHKDTQLFFEVLKLQGSRSDSSECEYCNVGKDWAGSGWLFLGCG